jgi:hypothetical protein
LLVEQLEQIHLTNEINPISFLHAQSSNQLIGWLHDCSVAGFHDMICYEGDCVKPSFESRR